MGVTYGFFDSVDGDRKYNADDISNYFLKLISDGVFPTPADSMQVQESSGMTIKVTPGWGFIKCKWIHNDSDYFLTLDQPDIILNRADRIVLRLNRDTSLRNIEIAVKRGTPGETPIVPNLQRDENVWELSLAYVMVWSGRTAITQADIADQRPYSDVCGWVTGLIDQIDTTNLFAQYDSAFSTWFNAIQQDIVPNATLVRQIQAGYTTRTDNESVITIANSHYNPSLDVLNVYVNGMRLAPDIDFTVNVSETGYHTIKLAKALDIIGTQVEFEILKSLYAENLDSVLDIVVQMENQVNRISQDCYYCNGVNDNIELISFISTWKTTHAGETLKIIGKFGLNEETTTVDDTNYSLVYRHSDSFDITLDFSECSMIESKNTQFAYFSGCHIKGLSVRYPNLTIPDESTTLNLIAGLNANFEDCHIYGAVTASSATIVYCYYMIHSRLIQCSADFYTENAVRGITASNDSIIDNCDINLTGTGSNPVYGVAALDCHGSNSRFTATGAVAYGGQGGGNYTECTFIGKGETKGYGFYINVRLHASNCTFKGFTKDSENGIGIGLSGGNVSKMLLHGIRCPQEAVISVYNQTGSMVFEGGEGFYTGEFYTNPVLPATDTILTYTNFKPTIALTQAEYDAIESPNADTLYIITE